MWLSLCLPLLCFYSILCLKNDNPHQEEMTSWAVYAVRCFLSFKHFFFSAFGWFIVYCQPLAWALFVFEPRCDSSISSLSTSHFLQCSSFSFWSIASAEVRRRKRSVIMHPTGKRSKRKSSTMNSKVQPLSKKPFRWHFQTDPGRRRCFRRPSDL